MVSLVAIERSLDWSSDPGNIGRFRVFQHRGYWMVRAYGSYEHKAFPTLSDAMNAAYKGEL